MNPNKNYLLKESGEMVGKFEAMKRVKWMGTGTTITIEKVYDD